MLLTLSWPRFLPLIAVVYLAANAAFAMAFLALGANVLMTLESVFGIFGVALMILWKGIDETFSQTVHSRSSYKAREILWGAKFADICLREGPDIVGIDLGRLSDLKQVTAT